jgi:hypothetical protein
MSRTLINAHEAIKSDSIFRSLLNTDTPGSAVTTKILSGSNITIGYTGIDSGTGDVTINSVCASYISDTPPATPANNQIWWNSSDGQLYIYYSSQWIQTSTISGANTLSIFQSYSYTSTSGQTTFSGSDTYGNILNYTPGLVLVYIGGIFLNPTQYTATNNTTVIVSSGVSLGQIVNIVAFNAYNIANVYTKTQSDSKYSLIPIQYTPATSSSTGTIGTITYDTNYMYICTSTNTWKRVLLSSF